MDVCDGPLAPVVRALNREFGWACEPLGTARAILSTGRRFTDSEPVEVTVSVDGDIVTVSDGGLMLARLALAGFELDDDLHMGLWRDALYAARLSYDDGLVHLTASLSSTSQAVRRVADGMLGLDALQLVAFPKATRVRTFADDVEDYLRSSVGEEAVTRFPVIDVGDMTVRPTFRVQAKRGPILLQTAATTAFKQAFEHAYVTFSLIERSEQASLIPVERRLIVLGGSELTWGRARISMLADVAFVGLWSERAPIRRFLDGVVPRDRVLVGT
jgi:hypothetical protein